MPDDPKTPIPGMPDAAPCEPPTDGGNTSGGFNIMDIMTLQDEQAPRLAHGSDGDDLLDIPGFLRRAAPLGAPQDAQEKAPGWYMPPPPARARITRGQKDNMAQAVAAAVKAGADTFGKLRKRFPEEAPRLLRAGLNLAIRLTLVARDGRRYSRR